MVASCACENYTNTFEVNMSNQDITKKQFSTAKNCTTEKQTLILNTCMEEKYITLLLRKSMLFSQALGLL